MPTTFTDQYSIDKELFAETGALDIILDVDTKVFIFPTLLDICNVPEFVGARKEIEDYFTKLISFIDNSLLENDDFWKNADRLLAFTEISGTCIGYSQYSTDGNAIGPKLRKSIIKNIKRILKSGSTSPDLFNLLSIFQSHISCDRISDLITYIIKERIFAYSQRIVVTFGLADTEIICKPSNIKYKALVNPLSSKKIVLFLPKVILTPLPVAEEFWKDTYAHTTNEIVRKAIQTFIDLNPNSRLTKSEILNLMVTKHDFTSALLSLYRDYDVSPYDFSVDVQGVYAWYFASKEFSKRFPIQLDLSNNPSLKDLKNFTLNLLNKFQHLIEEDGLNSFLFGEAGKPRQEKAIQQLFFGIVDAYLAANKITINHRYITSKGQVQIQTQETAPRIVVDIKLSSNKQLKSSFESKFSKIRKDQNISSAFYVVIDNGNKNTTDALIDIYNKKPGADKAKIYLQIINGIPK